MSEAQRRQHVRGLSTYKSSEDVSEENKNRVLPVQFQSNNQKLPLVL